MKQFCKELVSVLSYGGKPGWILLGYFIVQIVFARNKSSMTEVDGSAMIFATYALGAGIYSFIDLRKDQFSKVFFSILLKRTCLKWFVLYTMLCGISAFWSPEFYLSIYRALECFCMILLNAAVIKNVVKNFDFNGVMTWCVSYAFVMMTFLIINYAQSGMVMMLYYMQFPSTIFFYLYFYFSPKKIMKYPMLLIALACRSTTGYIGMAMGMCSLIFGNSKYKTFGWIVSILLAISIGIIGVDGVLNNTIFASKGGNVITNGQLRFNEEHSSGRSKLWEIAIKQINNSEKEWTGYGFVAGETSLARRIIGGQVIGMHNGFLSAYIGTGYIGLILFSLFILGYTRSVFVNKIPTEYKIMLIAVFFAIIVHTLGNPGLGFRVYGTWMHAMFFIMLTLGLNIRTKYMEEYEPPYSVIVDKGVMSVVEIDEIVDE